MSEISTLIRKVILFRLYLWERAENGISNLVLPKQIHLFPSPYQVIQLSNFQISNIFTATLAGPGVCDDFGFCSIQTSSTTSTETDDGKHDRTVFIVVVVVLSTLVVALAASLLYTYFRNKRRTYTPIK